MDNIFEVLKKAIENKHSGFETADFSLLGLENIPTDNEILEQNEDYNNIISEVNADINRPVRTFDKKYISSGQGHSKTAYPIKSNKILLKSLDLVKKPSQVFFNALALKKLGINIAMPLYFTTQKTGSQTFNYEVQEEASGSSVFAKSNDVLRQHILSFNRNINPRPLHNDSLVNNYNFQMLKYRAFFGLPFMKKNLFDFCYLSRVVPFDVGSTNAYFSSTKGYTYFDLDLDQPLVEPKDNQEYEKLDILSLIKEKIKQMATLHYDQQNCEDFIAIGLGLYSQELFDYFSDELAFNRNVYSGVLTYQALEAMKSNSIENENFNPYLPNTRKVALNITEKLNTHTPIQAFSYISVMAPNTLLKLEEGLINNNQAQLDEIREEYGLSPSFDFSCIDIPYFLKTMKATHEFDFTNPNPAPTQHLTRDHIGIKENNGELEYEFV